MEENMEEKDELDDLFVDKDATIDKRALAEILRSRVELTKNGDIHFLPLGQKMGAQAKLLLFLLGKKAIALKFDIEEKIGPKEIEDATGMPHGTVTSKLGFLKSNRYVNVINGKYSVPNYAIAKVKNEYFRDDGDDKD